jgi:hypothetical protein
MRRVIPLAFVAALLTLAPPRVRAADEAPPPVPPPPPAEANDPKPAKPAPPPPAAPSDPNALLSQAQIQALFDAGNYTETLKALARVLPLKGKAGAEYDRYKLLLLKAETHAKLKMQAPAIQALNDAASETDDEPARQNARALAQLIKRSKGFLFTPKPPKKGGKPPAPIDVTDPIARKLALRAMLDEELARVAPKVKAALEESSLPPIASAIEAAAAVRELEVGVTGSDENSKAMVADLGVRGRELVTKALEKMSKRVDEITRDANQTVRERFPVVSANGVRSIQERVRRRGLKHGEDRELKELINQLPPIAKSGRELIAATGGKKSEGEAFAETCSELSKRAKKTLEADYSSF